MTTLYARFIIPKTDWLSSNQRLNGLMVGLRSKRVQDYAEGVWRRAVLDQFGITPLEPEPIHVDDMPVIVDDDIRRMESRLDDLRAERDSCGRDSARRADISAAIKRQRHELSLRRGVVRREDARARRVRERNADKSLVRSRILLNTDNRVFHDPVECHVRVHNISKHLFDSPNAYPTVKPIQDAATRTGVIWEDDNNTRIPLVTFTGGSMLSHDYVIDMIVRDASDGHSPFLDGDDGMFDELPLDR